MPRDAFLWALGIVTGLVGVVALVMAMRRFRVRRPAIRRGLAERSPVRPQLPPPRRALPDAALSAARLGAAARVEGVAATIGHGGGGGVSAAESEEYEEVEVEPVSTPTKICPACGSRYGAGYRVCVRDDSDLAALN
jgi:hypothetical protein